MELGPYKNVKSSVKRMEEEPVCQFSISRAVTGS